MNETSRIHNSFLNLISGFAYRILITLTAFVVRTVFIRCLSPDYLGINGLYSNILSMLSLAELGFGTAMVYSMYQPLAQRDFRKLGQLTQLYKKVYAIIGTVILVFGLCLVPFLDHLIKDRPDVEGITFYYILFLLNTVVSYWFFAYQNSLLQADQKAFVISNYHSFFNLIKSALQIILLLVFRNYTMYLLTQIFCTVGENICLAVKVKKEYPVFADASKEKLSAEETKKIFKDVKALMLSKVSHVVLNGTDNLIISAFVGINWVGVLSNYVMVTEAITGILTQITSAIHASLGNYFAKENREFGYQLFRRIEFLNYWLYGFSTVAFIVLLNPFVTVWLGKEFTLSNGVVVALAINFFVAGVMNTLWTFRSTLGLFTQGQYRPLIVAVINVVVSIALSYKWGIAGVLAGTSISRACVNLWYDPWLLHRKGFGKSVVPFFLQYIRKILLLGVIAVGMFFIANNIVLVDEITIVNFSFMVVLTAFIPNLVFALAFCRTEEFQYYWQLLGKIIARVKRK